MSPAVFSVFSEGALILEHPVEEKKTDTLTMWRMNDTLRNLCYHMLKICWTLLMMVLLDH